MILINNLDFGYSKHKVFENLNLTFDEGKIYGLLGLNGAGKSTLLYLMGGLLFADNGKVEFNGFDMRERNPRALADLFFVPEEFELPDVKFETYIKLHAPFYPNFSRETLDRCLSGFHYGRADQRPRHPIEKPVPAGGVVVYDRRAHHHHLNSPSARC